MANFTQNCFILGIGIFWQQGFFFYTQNAMKLLLMYVGQRKTTTQGVQLDHCLTFDPVKGQICFSNVQKIQIFQISKIKHHRVLHGQQKCPR